MRKVWRAAAVAGAAAVLLMVAGAARANGAQAEACPADAAVATICQDIPEDLVPIPGTDLLLSSALGGKGGVYLVETRGRTSTLLWHPAQGGAERFDRKAYPACPGPPVGEDRVHFDTHGLALRAGTRGTATVYAVHHGMRETIEVFALSTAEGAGPQLTWTGCIPAPAGAFLNSVVPADRGSLLATWFFTGGAKDIPAFVAGGRDVDTGGIWQWRPGKGWNEIPGTRAPGPNGIAQSGDGKWLFMAAWRQGTLQRFARGPGKPRRTVVDLGFRVDNLRWGDDGLLYAAGQGFGDSSHVVAVNPATLTVTPLLGRKDSATLAQATVALPVRDEIWIGFIGSNRIGIFPRRALPDVAVQPQHR